MNKIKCPQCEIVINIDKSSLFISKKDFMLEFNKYKISYYPSKWKCNTCKEEFILIYSKGESERYCKKCLTIKVIEMGS